MQISASGAKNTAEAEFGEYIAAIIGYTPAAGIEAVEWYIAASLCCDCLCNLPISNRQELEDFLEKHQSQIVGTIATASA